MRHIAIIAAVLAACGEPPEDRPDWLDSDLPRVNISAVTLSPEPVNFGTVPPGEESKIQLQLTNNDDVDLYLLDATINPAGEAVDIPGRLHDDIIFGVMLAPGESYTFRLSMMSERPIDYNGLFELYLPGNARKSVRVMGSVE